MNSTTDVNSEVPDETVNAEEDVKRDIESDPFFSGGHISLLFKLTTTHTCLCILYLNIVFYYFFR